jgi:hypothetical protein
MLRTRALEAAYLCLHRVRGVQSPVMMRALEDPYLVSNAVVLIAVLAPALLAVEMVANCWVHEKTREDCDPDGQVPEMVQAVTTTVFAWLATPPR